MLIEESLNSQQEEVKKLPRIYNTIPQRAINGITSKDMETTTALSDEARVTINGVLIKTDSVEDYPFTVTVNRLLDYIIEKLCKKLPGKKELSQKKVGELDKFLKYEFSAEEYARKCHNKSIKKTKEQLKKDLQALFHLSFNFKYKDKSKSIRIIDDICEEDCSFAFSLNFIQYLANDEGILIDFPEEIMFSLDLQKFPNSYTIAKCLLNHCNMNYKKEIPVKTVLNNCPTIPNYKCLTDKKGKNGRKNSDGHVFDRMVNRFERSMDHLVEKGFLKSWRYCGKKKAKLTDYQEKNKNKYKVFINLYIDFELGEWFFENKKN